MIGERSVGKFASLHRGVSDSDIDEVLGELVLFVPRNYGSVYWFV